MPTPIVSARQCLTPEAAQALDEAVAVARRRSHSQTTSLHAVSALLSLPSSALRDACFRARSNPSYPTRMQIKALELSLSVSLDRQPSGQRRADDPPVSNSLMAAIKRSQANQRRHPDNFHIYQQMHQQSPASVTCVKVELKHLTLSILDDPVVSRVFGEAGFRSWDVKLAILRPHPPLLRYPRARGPPLFLCNLGEDSDLDGRPFSFPFPEFSDADEDCRRIGEVLLRSSGRNPLLVGLRAKDALRSFETIVHGKTRGALPMEISGLSILSVENEISNYSAGKCNERSVDSRLEEVGRMAERCLGPGLAVNYGDLKVLTGDEAGVGAGKYVVTQLTKLLRVHVGKIWLLGAAESFETYLSFLARFPFIEERWDLQLLHITSLRVPAGKALSGSSSYPFRSRCEMCDKKCEHELTALSEGVFTYSIADKFRSTLPSWLQMAEFGADKRFDAVPAKDDDRLWNAKVTGLHKKWDGICQHLHGSHSNTDSYQMNPLVPGSHLIDGRKRIAETHGCNDVNSSSRAGSSSGISTDSPKAATLNPTASVRKLRDEPSTAADDPCMASVTTDLGLGIAAPPCEELKKLPNRSSFLDSCDQLGARDFKTICKTLTERIGWQAEAISAIVDTIARRRASVCNLRRAIWLNFLGSDTHGKKKVAVALAKALYGSRRSFIGVDLASRSFVFQKQRGSTVVDCIARELRCKPLSIVFLENVDQADALARNSLSCALRTGKFPDSHGREVGTNDSIFITTSMHGDGGVELPSPENESTGHQERRSWSMEIVVGPATREEFLDASSSNFSTSAMNKRKSKGCDGIPEQRVQKAPHKPLDLNLPADEDEGLDISNSSEYSPDAWLEEFSGMIDGAVVFKPFDFGSIAEEVMKGVRERFHRIVGWGCSLVIGSEVLDRMVTVAWRSDDDRTVEDWVERVLGPGFAEARKMGDLDAGGAVVRLKELESEGNRPEQPVPEDWGLPEKIILSRSRRDC